MRRLLLCVVWSVFTISLLYAHVLQTEIEKLHQNTVFRNQKKLFASYKKALIVVALAQQGSSDISQWQECVDVLMEHLFLPRGASVLMPHDAPELYALVESLSTQCGVIPPVILLVEGTLLRYTIGTIHIGSGRHVLIIGDQFISQRSLDACRVGIVHELMHIKLRHRERKARMRKVIPFAAATVCGVGGLYVAYCAYHQKKLTRMLAACTVVAGVVAGTALGHLLLEAWYSRCLENEANKHALLSGLVSEDAFIETWQAYLRCDQQWYAEYCRQHERCAAYVLGYISEMQDRVPIATVEYLRYIVGSCQQKKREPLFGGDAGWFDTHPSIQETITLVQK